MNMTNYLKTWVYAEAINVDRFTKLCGIVHTFNEHNGFVTDDNSFSLEIYNNQPLTESYTLRVCIDDKGVLRLSKKDLSRSKEAFIKTCENVFFEDAEIETASDVYKHKCWQHIQKWIELHKQHERDHVSTIDILHNVDKGEWIFKAVPHNGKESIKTITINRVERDFIFKDGKILFRTSVSISDEARGILFSGSYVSYANKLYHMEPNDLDLYFALRRVVHVNPAHLRVAILKAMDDASKPYEMSGIFASDNVMDGLMWDAGKGYEKVLKFYTEQLNA